MVYWQYTIGTLKSDWYVPIRYQYDTDLPVRYHGIPVKPTRPALSARLTPYPARLYNPTWNISATNKANNQQDVDIHVEGDSDKIAMMNHIMNIF